MTSQSVALANSTNLVNKTETNTITGIENSGLGTLVETISHEFNLKTFDEKTDIPIPPDKLPQSNLQINIDPETASSLTYISGLTNEVPEVGEVDFRKEFPFCLTGKMENNILEISHFAFLHTSSIEKLSADVVYPDSEKTNTELNTAIGDPNTNVFILGHTHPNVPEEIKNTKIAAKISKENKEQFGTREPGLNISLGDLYQLESIAEQKGTEIKMMSAVLMYNGELVIIGADNNQFSQTTKQL